MRFSTFARGFAVVAIMAAAVGIVSVNSGDMPAVAADYLVQSDVVATELSQPVESAEDVATLTDWEYTLRSRPAKCRFIP